MEVIISRRKRKQVCTCRSKIIYRIKNERHELKQKTSLKMPSGNRLEKATVNWEDWDRGRGGVCGGGAGRGGGGGG